MANESVNDRNINFRNFLIDYILSSNLLIIIFSSWLVTKNDRCRSIFDYITAQSYAAWGYIQS
jgi:hypothetical protein